MRTGVKAETDWKYYSPQGEVIIDKRYALYYPFTEDGLAVAGKGNFVVREWFCWVKQDGLWGVIDKPGALVLKTAI